MARKGALAVLHCLLDAEPLPESIVVPPACLFTCKARPDLWHAVVVGEEPDCEVRPPLPPPPLRRQGGDNCMHARDVHCVALPVCSC